MTRTKRLAPSAIRIPTPEEFAAYDGAHCSVLWRGLAPDWRCPGCSRSKFEILCWTRRFKIAPEGTKVAYMGWLANLDQHHDHSQDDRFSTSGRFLQVPVCKHCNAADGTAKKRLKLPPRFSFAPWEIARFVQPQAHGPHRHCWATAKSIYDALPPVGRFW